MKQVIKRLKDQEWDNAIERPLIEKAVSNLEYYRYLMPKTLKNDIIDILNVAIMIKQDYQKYKKTTLKRRNSI